jgi:hypothetical protein
MQLTRKQLIRSILYWCIALIITVSSVLIFSAPENRSMGTMLSLALLLLFSAIGGICIALLQLLYLLLKQGALPSTRLFIFTIACNGLTGITGLLIMLKEHTSEMSFIFLFAVSLLLSILLFLLAWRKSTE